MAEYQHIKLKPAAGCSKL